MNHLTTCGDDLAVQNTDDRGFTLVEILIAIVLVGVLSAVAVVGITSLTSRGSESACEASLDAAKAASVVYFTANANTYPTTFGDLTGGDDPALELPSEATVSADGSAAATGTWTLSMAASEGARPTFTCS